jgi:hypothetical protein
MSEIQDLIDQDAPEAPPRKKSKRGWLIGGCAVIGLLVVAAGVLFAVFDPFGLVAMLFGGGKIAEIVPDDVLAYGEVDLLSFRSEGLQEIIEAFQDAAEDAFDEDAEDIEDSFEDSFGVKMEDVYTWIGQYVGIVFSEFDMDDEIPQMVLIIEARDTEGADEFVADVVDHREDEFDDEFDEFEFDGAMFYDNEDDYDPLIVGRYKNYVFFATDLDSLEDVLDLAEEGRQAEETLADSELYIRTLEALPEEGLLTLYFNYEELLELNADLMDEMSYGLDFSYEYPEFGAGFGISVSVVEAGIQLDMVTVYEDPEELPWADLDIDMTDFEPQTTEMLPEETFFYVSGYVPEDYAPFMLETLGEDYLEALELLGGEVDIDLEDLFNSLEGEMAFAIFEQDDGFAAEFLEIPLGVSLLIGIKDDGEWDELFGLLTEQAGSDSMTVIDEVDLDDFDLLSISMDDGYDRFPFIIYGTGNDFAVLSTLVEDPEILTGDGDTLADSDDFQEVWEAFPEGGWPVMYIDIEGLVAYIEDVSESLYGGGFEEPDDSIGVIEPLTMIAATSTRYASLDTQIVTVIFFIDR